MPSKRIDQYEIIREIGRGGMGNVYLCKDLEIARVVALKVMREDLAKPLREIDRQRFIREALTTARLQHPGIPPVFCVRRSSEGLLYYAMKLIEGHSLDEIIKGLQKDDPKIIQKYPTLRLVEVLRDVCQTLSYTHAKGFLHRDLKPSNIFIGDYGEVYLIDWGLTKKFGPDLGSSENINEDSTLFDEISITDENTHALAFRGSPLIKDAPDEEMQLTLQGDLLGTPAYMAPEQTLRNGPELTAATDIYSLGVILYRILTLRLPIESKDLKELVIAKREGHLAHPDDIAPDRDIPPELAAIAMQAMNTRPNDRFESVMEFSRSLEFWLDGKSQFRGVDLGSLSMDKFICRPTHTANRWILNEDVIKTVSMGRGQQSRLIFRRAIYGDIHISLNLRLLPIDSEGDIRRFGIMFKSSEPVSVGPIDHYALTFAGNNNTRLNLTRNGTEIASNENIIFEPDKKYHIVIETHRGDIQVTINARLVLSCLDRSPLTGAWLGFLHHGQPVIFSRLVVMTRGLPLKTETIEIPEALMAEGCYEGARRRFMDLYRNHRNRYVGSWAAYRAGVAAFRATRRHSDALRIWAQLRGSRYSDLEKLGMARIELLENRPLEAAAHIQRIIENNPTNILLRSVADFTQEHTQKLLRHEDDPNITWVAVDRWIRLTLSLDQLLNRRDPITLSLIWHWLFNTINSQPQQLRGTLTFIRRTYGEGRGQFLEQITNEDQLDLLIRRSLTFQNHTFLIEKLMRLIIWHDDPIEDLETLGRFYLNSGHERIALQIFQQLIRICINSRPKCPPAPMAYVGMYLWLHSEEDEARKIFKMMDRYGDRWAASDAQFFIGLDDYRLGRRLNAVERWKNIQQHHSKPFHHCIAGALLGQLPPDPVLAGVPDRHDYRFLFYFIVGLRYLIDWKDTKDEHNRKIATDFFTEVKRLIKPSYDIYASTESFARLPLEMLGAPLSEKARPEVLSDDEKSWLKNLIMTVRHEVIPKSDA
jgi:serine/threonine protein kinase